MKAILTFDNKIKKVVDILRLPPRPMTATQIERELMENMNAKLTAHKVTKVHLLRH